MQFTVNNEADCNGTALESEMEASYHDLRELFGEPKTGSCDGGTSTEWDFVNEDGQVATLYDWKETCLYDLALPSIYEFRKLPMQHWNIGSKKSNVALELRDFVLKQIKRLKSGEFYDDKM